MSEERRLLAENSHLRSFHEDALRLVSEALDKYRTRARSPNPVSAANLETKGAKDE
jgi:hypothetical protein